MAQRAPLGFAIFKHDITDSYHHVSREQLKRYLAEFDFRYNERAALGVMMKPSGAPHPRHCWETTDVQGLVSGARL
jgi:hypothetical protein